MAMPAISARHSRAAVWTTVSSTGCTSAVERLMTLSTSLVAVWYSSDSARSRVRGLQFGEQPRILHRDDRLVGKGAHQFDLPLGERLHSIPREINRPEHGPLAQQRYPESGASPGRRSFGKRVVRISEDVFDMNDPAFEQHPAGETIPTGDNRSLAQFHPKLGVRCTVRTRRKTVDLALAYCDVSGIGAA